MFELNYFAGKRNEKGRLSYRSVWGQMKHCNTIQTSDILFLPTPPCKAVTRPLQVYEKWWLPRPLLSVTPTNPCQSKISASSRMLYRQWKSGVSDSLFKILVKVDVQWAVVLFWYDKSWVQISADILATPTNVLRRFPKILRANAGKICSINLLQDYFL
jgi:hypothetical protein